MPRLADDVAVITGGGAGIGRAIAQLFAAEGARVAVADVDVEAAATVAKSIRETGGQARALPLDVRDAVSVTAVFEEVERLLGPVSVLVNNAGGSRDDDGPVHALGGDSPAHAYSAAKGGVIATTRSMAARYAADGIRVNAIAPGIVLTERVTARIERDRTDLTEIRTHHPHAVGSPDDVARIALFLASPDSRLITGSTLAADGGLSLY